MLFAGLWPFSETFGEPWGSIIGLIAVGSIALGMVSLAIFAGLVASRKPGRDVFGNLIEEKPRD